MKGGAPRRAPPFFFLKSRLVLFTHAGLSSLGYPFFVPCGDGAVCASFEAAASPLSLPDNRIQENAVMFDVYLLPEEITEPRLTVYAFKGRNAEFIDWLMSRTRRCLIVVTFAGVVPPFSDLTGLHSDDIQVVD